MGAFGCCAPDLKSVNLPHLPQCAFTTPPRLNRPSLPLPAPPRSPRSLCNCSYVALWIFLSAAVILYNKWVLAYHGFPYPVALTMW